MSGRPKVFPIGKFVNTGKWIIALSRFSKFPQIDLMITYGGNLKDEDAMMINIRTRERMVTWSAGCPK